MEHSLYMQDSVRDRPQDWKKTFANQISGKEFVSGTHK